MLKIQAWNYIYHLICKCDYLLCSGYMSPEYALDGFFSIKSDVFSFGVVLLEILSGKRNTSFYKSEQAMNLLGYVSCCTG